MACHTKLKITKTQKLAVMQTVLRDRVVPALCAQSRPAQLKRYASGTN